MKKTMAALLLAAAALGLAGCTETEKQEAVEPVVREIVESLLAPMTADEEQDKNDMEEDR